MRDHGVLLRRQAVERRVVGNGERHTRDRAQRVAVADVELLRHRYQRLRLRKDRLAARRVRVVHDARVGHGQPRRGGELRRQQPQHLDVRRDVALGELPEHGVFTRVGVARRREKRADILLELLVDERVVLCVRDAQQVFLRRRRELQPDGRVCDGADVAVDQPAHRLLDPRAPEGLVAGRVPDQRFHQRAAHAVRVIPR